MNFAHVPIASEGWYEATELNKEINHLQQLAFYAGWRPLKDKKFEELDEDNAFQRPDGPSSIITYLKNVINSDKSQSPTTQSGPSTADPRAGEL